MLFRSFRLNKEQYQQGELILISGNRLGKLSNNAKAAITVYADERKVNSTQLHYSPVRERWEGQLWASSPGEYTYELTFEDQTAVSTQSGSLTVLQSQIELNNVSLNQDLLSSLSVTNQGKYFSWGSRDKISEHIQNVSIDENRKVEIDLTKRTWVFILVLVLLAVEWGIRRKIGLP